MVLAALFLPTVEIQAQCVGPSPLPVAITQSTNYLGTGNEGTLANIVDNNFATGPGTFNGVGQYIRLDFGSAVQMTGVTLSPLTLTGWGPTYLNGATLQYSTNGTTWTTIQTIAGTANNTLTTFNFASITARYIQLVTTTNTYLGTSEFRVTTVGVTLNVTGIQGTVFNDFNNNGVLDLSDSFGFAGVKVYAFNCAGVKVDEATTNLTGQYSLTTVTNADGPLRIEFDAATFPSWTRPTANGTSNRTDVQVVQAPNCNVNLGLVSISDYCQNAPRLMATCFVNGLANNTTAPTPVIASIDYLGSGTNPAGKRADADKNQIGSVWGLAYKPATSQLFSATFLKRHVGIKGSLGDIYVTTPGGATDGALFVTIPNAGSIGTDASRGLGVPTGQSVDLESFAKVGRVGLGGLSLSADGNTLYTINLNSKELVAVNLTTKALANIAIPTICDLTKGQQVPFAVKYWRGKVYVGVVCDASISNNRADLKAHVLVFDPATATFDPSPVLNINLDYLRGIAWNNAGYTFNGQSAAALTNRWYPWVDTYDKTKLMIFKQSGDSRDIASHPTPILSDLEFDANGNMILGFMDRIGHLFGDSNRTPDNATDEASVTGGDILKATFVSNTSWTIEPTIASGGEFFTGDNFLTDHQETSDGGVYYSAQDNLVVMTALDPLAYNSGGFVYLSNSSGAQPQSGAQLFAGNLTNGFFGKASGLGDAAAQCNLLPIEIGNRVWIDQNRDGVQDPCANEPGVAGLRVNLYDNTGRLVGKTTTNAVGEYYFNTTNVATQGVNANTGVPLSGIYTGPAPVTAYCIVFGNDGATPQYSTATAVFSLSGTTYGLTTANSTTSHGNDQNDSDADIASGSPVTAANGYPSICLTTPDAGANHTFDVGLRVAAPCPQITFSTPSAATVTQCSKTALNLSVSTNAVAPDAIQFVYFPTAQTGTAMYSGGTVLGSVNSTTATGTKILSLAAIAPTNVTTSTQTYYVYAILQSADGLCKPVDSFVLNVTPEPIAVVGGEPVVCQGTSATLTLPPGLSYRWSTGAVTRQIFAPISATTTSAVFSATLTAVGGCVSNPATFTVTGVACTSCTAGAGRIGGVVSVDFDGNGVRSTTEPGLSGITVTIFACDANGNSTPVSATTTDITGSYFFTGLTDGTTYRVEFSNLPARFDQSVRGTQNGTSVQFVQSPTCTVNLGLNDPADYCQADARAAVVCFPRNNDPATEPVIIDFAYNDGTPFVARQATDSDRDWAIPQGTLPTFPKNMVGLVSGVGTTFGLAYDKMHRRLFSGSFMRAYAPMKTAANGFGEGVIYAMSYSDGMGATPVTWLDLETVLGVGISGTFVSDNTYPGPTSYGRTNSNPAKIGYTGLGSMRMADDDSELYVVNLKTQEVLVIPVDATTGAAVPGGLKHFPFPTNGCPTGTWADPAADVRPYRAALGLGIHPVTKRVFATLTCTGPTLNDLKGLVYSFDPSDVTPSVASFRLETTIPLNQTIPATNPNVSQWYEQIVHPWQVVTPNAEFYENSSGSNTAQHTQPWLGEVEFDRQPNGTHAMLVSTRNRYHDIINSSFYVASGVLHRVANTGSDASPGWTLESNAVVNGQVSTVNWTLSGANNAGGNTSLENRFFKYVGAEGAMMAGTLDYVPGRPEIIAPTMDNVFYSGTSGITWLNRTTGERSRDMRILGDYTSAGFNNNNFTKANNWGGIVVMCNEAPIQIGNRVWRDDNRNGIQDPCEPPIVGAVVKLYNAAKTTELASVTTNAAGEYYFSSTTITAGTSTSSVATSLLTYNTTFALVITSLGTGTAVTSQSLLLTDVSPVTPGESGTGNSGTTLINNDAKVDVVGGISRPCIKLTTGGPGESNHTYDFGLAKVVCSLTATAQASSQTVANGGSVTLTAQVSPAGSYTYAWNGPNGVTISPTNTSAVVASNLPTGTQTFTVTVSSSPTCSTTAVVSVTVAAPACTVSVTLGTPVCNTLTNVYSLSGAVLFANVQNGPLTILDNGQPITPTATNANNAPFVLTGVSNASSHTVTATFPNCPVGTATYVAPVSCTVCTLTATAQASASNTICVGQPVTVFATASPAGSYTYSWAAPAGTLTGSSSATATITNLPTGTHTFTVTVSSSPGCSTTATVSVTVNALPTPTVNNPTICAGQLAVLTVQNCAGTVQWSANANSATTQSVTVSPTQTTMYSVSCTANGCMGSTTATVTVNAQPVINSMSAGACVGITASVTVNASTTSGTLEYNFNGGAFTSANTFTLTAPTPTTVTVVVRTVGSSCTATQSIPINCACQTPATVSLLPASPQTCGQTPVSLTAGVGGGATSATLTSSGTGVFSNAVVNGSATPTYTPSTADVSAGSVTLTITSADPDGVGLCVAASQSRVLTINPLPTVGLPSITICAGQSATLTATGGAGPPATSYSFAPAGGTQTGNMYVVSPAQTTIYSVTGLTSAGCSNIASGTVTVVGPPNAGSDQTLVCGPVGQSPTSTTLAATNATSGQWSAAAGNPQSTTFSAVSSLNTSVSGLTVPGTYTFVFTTPQSCTDAVTVMVPPCQCNLALSATPSSPTLTQVQPVTLTATVSPAGAYNYVWSGPGGVVITPTNTSAVVASNLSVGTSTFSVTAISSNPACFTTTTVSVTVLEPILAVVVGTPICNTLTNNYTATGTVSLTNSPAGSLTITDNGTTIAVVVVTAGQTSASFSVTGVSGSSPASHTVRATLNTITASTTYATPASCTLCSLSITASSAMTICAGQSATLTATATSGTAGYSYIWQPSATLTGANTATAVATPTATTTYSVLVTDARNCTALATVTVTVNGQPSIVSLVRGMCVGNLVSVTANASLTGAGTVEYSFNGGAFQPSSTTTIIANGPTSVAVVVRTVGSTCTVTQSTTVDCACQNPANVSLLPASPATCGQTPVSLTAIVSGGTTSGTLTSSGTGVFSNAVVNGSATVTYTPSVADVTAGSVTLTSTSADPDGLGLCVPVSQSRVLVINPIPSVLLNSVTICSGVSATLTATAGANVYTFAPTGGVQTGNVYVVSPSITTMYSVTGVTGNCSATATGAVTTFPKPSVGANQTLVCANGEVPTSTTLTAQTNSSVLTGQWYAQPGNPSATTFANATSLTTTVSGLLPGQTYHFVWANTSGCANGLTVTVGMCATVGTGSLGNFVWKDNNNNGRQDASEPGVATVTVQLFSVIGGVRSSTPLATTVTSASGLYGFSNLPQGDYQVRFTIPASLTGDCRITLLQNAGPDDTGDSDVDPTTGFSPVITIDPTQPMSSTARNNPTIDMGLTIIPLARISDPCHCFGVEYGLGETRELYEVVEVRSSTGQSWSVVSQRGMLALDTLVKRPVAVGDLLKETSVESGIYHLEFTHEDAVGYSVTVTNGTQTLSIGNTCNLYPSYTTTVLSETMCRTAAPIALTALTGSPGTARFYYIDKTTKQRIFITQFDPAQFAEGDEVEVKLLVEPTDVTKCSSTIVQTVLINSTGCAVGSLGNFVWKDNNNNGQQDPNEPGVEDVTVQLFRVVAGVTSTTPLATTITGASGLYAFTNLLQGDYRVKFTLPDSQTAGCQITPIQNAGGDDTKDSDVDPLTGFSPVVSINPSVTGLSTNNLTIDLGVQRKIYDPIGYVYCYTTNTILKGGTISVTGPGSISIIKDGLDGSYQFFTDGTPGSYTLTYTHPNGYSIATVQRPVAASHIDPTGLEGTPADKDGVLNGWLSLGSPPDATANPTGLLDGSAAANPYYLVFDVRAGDPYVSENNLPVDCTDPCPAVCVPITIGRIVKTGQ